MDNIELKAETRTKKGNGPARAMRRDGRVPAVLYGPSTEPSMLSINAHDLEVIIKKGGLGRSVINLLIDDGKTVKPVMVKEMQTNPLSRDLLHVDLYEVSMDRKIKVNVPVDAVGNAAGVEMGGMLQIIRRELEVFCLPNAIPESIVIDVTALEIGDSVHVEDIPVEEGVEIPHDVNFTILTISAVKREEEEVEEEEGEEGEVAEGETEEEAAGEES